LEFKELIGIVEESALRCKNIVRSLLDFSHVSSGMFKPVSLNEIVEKVNNLVSHELRLQNINIEKELNPELPMVMGDEQLLQQVIFNLVSNAKWAIQKKSAKGSGTITIITKYNNSDKLINVCIADTGIGISKDHVDRMFEPFFTTKPVGEGTGLGLSLVYNVIKQHKGYVVVESQFGNGAIFKIFLPLIDGG
jgi:signal transduction histidine kinase